MAVFNPFLPSFLADPYRHYAALRASDPVHFSAALGAWVLTRYEDCERVLRDDATFSSNLLTAAGPLAEVLQQQRREFPLGEVPTVLNSDPPPHTRLRALVNRAFAARAVEELRPRIEDVTASLLDSLRPGQPFELMTGLAQPLPIIVIAELLGVPATDRELFKRWSTAIASTTNVLNPPPVLDAARRATEELVAYLDRVVAERRRAPADDLLSALLAVEDEGERLSHDELLAFAILLLLAGHETTTNLIGNGVLALAAHPDATERLRANLDEAMPAAVEELLRYDSPVQGVVRFTAADAEVGGTRIPKGSIVLALVGAANRDPAAFDDPDDLDLARARNRHLSFGRGIHFCLGAPLARLEGEIALSALLRRLPGLRVAEGGVERGGTVVLRGLTRLDLVG